MKKQFLFSTNIFSFIVLTSILLFTCCQNKNSSNKEIAATDAVQTISATPLSIFDNFVQSGWIGDAKDPEKRWVKIDNSCTVNPKAGDTCLKITYLPGGSAKWAGMHWFNIADNWCEKPGEDFSKKGFTKITFWARGESGGEEIEFTAGGVQDCPNGGGPYSDSFNFKSSSKKLETEWKEFTFDLSKKNLSSVIAGFAWFAGVPETEMTFYIDEVYFR